MKYSLSGLFGLSLFLNGINAYAGPWWTGPLLAPAGHTIPAGHINLETYQFITQVIGIYNSYGKVTYTPDNKSYVTNPLFSYGLSDKFDLQLSLPYSYNRNNGAHAEGLSDNGATLGYQLLEQKDSRWRPDLRVTLQEIFPTGRYDNLNPAKKGTDGTGFGCYQTALSLNFQQLAHFSGVHYLRTRLSLSYFYAYPTFIEGVSSYGGNIDTHGSINPGNMASIDLAGEFSITQHWVAVMEAFASRRQASHFSGFTGFDAGGMPLTIGNALSKEMTLAPAIEYNFSPNVGIIAGKWFTIRGKQTAKFSSAVIALNAYW